jgi:hypothetical protein
VINLPVSYMFFADNLSIVQYDSNHIQMLLPFKAYRPPTILGCEPTTDNEEYLIRLSNCVY